MENDLKRLKNITKNCRPDMHEPDEQGISAMVVGDHLDNAHGSSVGRGYNIERGLCYQEFVVVLKNEETGEMEPFNLATLIALARKAQLK
jgi:hypothetical protein